MENEKQRERLIELIKKSRREWLEKEYDNETEKSVDEYVADYLMSNNVVVLPWKKGDTLYSVTRLVDGKCDYYYYSNTPSSGREEWCGCDGLKRITRPTQSWCYCEELLPPLVEPKGKTITIPKWTYEEHKGE